MLLGHNRSLHELALHELALLCHWSYLSLLRDHRALLKRDLWLMGLGILHARTPLALLHSLHHLGTPRSLHHLHMVWHHAHLVHGHPIIGIAWLLLFCLGYPLDVLCHLQRCQQLLLLLWLLLRRLRLLLVWHVRHR